MSWSCNMFLLVFVVCSLLASVEPTAEIMKDVTLGFGEALKHCREESQLTEEKMEQFFHIWRDDFVFKDRELGCAIFCMSKYFNLLNSEHRMHHDNTNEFIKGFPDGEKLAKRMVEVIHTCEKKFNHEDDHCWRILHIAECFKVQIKADGIAPDIELLLAEFIMEAEV